MSRTIISASRRTDIPAFYHRWLLERLRAGYCEWIHPFGGRVQRVSLRPEDVLAIVFWTRDPGPLFGHLDALHGAGYHYCFHVTLTGYPRELEPRAPAVGHAVRALGELAGRLGPDGVVWRYDPILLGNRTTADWHVANFEGLARRLAGRIRRVFISFVDLYGKTRRNLEILRREQGIETFDPDLAERQALVRRLRGVADDVGMALHACCEDDLVEDGVAKGRCVDIDAIRRLRPDVEETPARRPTREQCGCSASVDIGAYDTCAFGCAYCYANRSADLSRERRSEHDPSDTMLWRPPRLRADGATEPGSAADGQ